MVHCTKNCGKMVKLGSYTKHLKDQCRSHYEVINSPSIKDILSRPTSLPATPAEKKIAEHLVRKIMSCQGESDEGVVRLPTSGQVCMNYQNLLVCNYNIFYYTLAHYLGASGWL